MEEKDFYIGLDIGTDSVGWAVTDTEYKVLRYHSKPLWGVHLFKGALTAAARRGFRTARRRLERRKQRLVLLQGLFASAIQPIDADFFVRLDESNLYQEDKTSGVRYSLFADKHYNDATFHRAYPTVYHLREAMLHAADPDPRLAYLAIHHIVKHRGHFLLEGDTLSATEDIAAPLSAINQWLSDQELPTLCVADLETIRHRLCLASLTARKEGLKEAFAATDKRVAPLVDIIAGGKVYADKLFGSVDKEDKLQIDLNADREAVEGDWRDKLGDDYAVVENAWLLYDYGRLHRLLGKDSTYISQGMVAKYDKHKRDLARLRALYRRHFKPDQYQAMFACPPAKKCNYTVYSGKYDFGPRGTRPLAVDKDARKNNTQEDFYKYVKEMLQSNPAAAADPDGALILREIAEGTFMPKQISKANSVLPYQCNLAELRGILDNLCRYPRYAFLLEADENGLRVRDKIESLVKFRMPYYVGPINNHSGKYWVVRRADGKVYPWNLDEQVDLEASEAAFIQRMTKACPYIPNAKVLPKCSLLYEEAALLNLINKIRIDGVLLSVEVKNQLSHHMAIPQPNGRIMQKLTKKYLRDWLRTQGYLSGVQSTSVAIDGMDDEIPIGRQTWASLCKLMGDEGLVQRYRDQFEDLIFRATICGPDKSNLRRFVKQYSRQHNDFLTPDQIKRFVGYTFNGWGRYSKDLLLGRYGTDPDTGEVQCVSVMDMLRRTNCNLTELLRKEDYGFADSLRQLQPGTSTHVDYADIDALYCSPAVKKQIWQAVRIINELKATVGQPKKVFVEMARGGDPKEAAKRENNRTQQRYQMLKKALDKLYKDKQLATQQATDIRAELDHRSARDLQNNRLFLYFMQNGLDAYTGEPIDYNHLSAYDRDHIYPQSKIKDDSILDNLVLTYREQNASKTDTYPIDREVQERMRPIWKAWLDCGLITPEKYIRLTRTTPLTEEECADFINRQLVETRQSTKEVCRLLKQIFPDTEVVYSKASLVRDFRQGVAYAYTPDRQAVCHPFVKAREINDLHHAKDAYLNIVVGNVYNTKFGHDARVYFGAHHIDHFALDKLYLRDVPNAWRSGAEGTMAEVIQTMGTNAMLFTRESYCAHGILNEVTILPKGEAVIPVKGGSSGKRAVMADMAKYGGYKSEVRRYYMLVQHTEGKGDQQKVRYTLVGVKGRYAAGLVDEPSRIAYCQMLGYRDPKILVDTIKIDAMFDFHGLLLTLSAATGKLIIWKLGRQMGFAPEQEAYFKKVYKVVDRYNQLQKSKIEYTVDEYDGITAQGNIEAYDHLAQGLAAAPYNAVSSMRTYVDNLLQKRQCFLDLGLAQQCIVLVQILCTLKCDAQASDLSLLGLGKCCGRIMLSQTFDSLDGIALVHRSVTGIYQQRIPLQSLVPDDAQ